MIELRHSSRRPHKRSHFVLLALFTTLLCAGANATTLYKWFDENGIVHYSERPPVGVTNFEKVTRDATPGNSPVEYETETPDSEAQDQESGDPTGQSAQQAAGDNSARCDNARKNLEALNSFARIRVQEPDGRMRFLSEQEIQERKLEYNAILEDECR